MGRSGGGGGSDADGDDSDSINIIEGGPASTRTKVSRSSATETMGLSGGRRSLAVPSQAVVLLPLLLLVTVTLRLL